MKISSTVLNRRLNSGNPKQKADSQSNLGTDFLQDVRTIVAHPNKVNLFVKTFRYNFLPNFSGEKRGG